MRIRNLRRCMGEEKWAEYQKYRKQLKNYASLVRKEGLFVITWRRKVKAKLIAYKGGKCQICGYNKNVPRAYVFHHNDPSQKEFGIASNGIPRSFEKTKKEVDKCTLLCVRCHSEIHSLEDERKKEETFGRYEERKKILKGLMDNIKTEALSKQKELKINQTKQLTKNNKSIPRPIKCNHKPTKEELEKLIQDHISWIKIGEAFGVTDNAMKKWARKYGILPPPRIYRKNITGCRPTSEAPVS